MQPTNNHEGTSLSNIGMRIAQSIPVIRKAKAHEAKVYIIIGSVFNILLTCSNHLAFCFRYWRKQLGLTRSMSY